MPQPILYYYEGCPYCDLVRRFLKDNHMTVLLKDIRKQPEARQELIKLGGKPQVPCLVMNGKALYESADIIEWLKSNWKK